MKNYHRSRKAILLFILLIFLNSVITLHMRKMQRERNFDYIEKKMENEYYEKLVDSLTVEVNTKSRREDTYLLILSNLSAVFLLIGLDKLGIFEKTGGTYRANKKFMLSKIKKGRP